MNCSLTTFNGRIDYELKRSRRKTLSVTINDQAQIRVGAPLWVEEKRIEQFLRSKSSWISKKRGEASLRHNTLRRKTFTHGETFLFLGKEYPLNIRSHQQKNVRISFDGTQWHVENGDVPLVKEKLVDWYRAQAKEILAGRVFHFARILGVEPKEIAVRTQKRLWGSCHPTSRKIHLNWQIVLSPLEVIDYVVVHELCHLLVANHSKQFWRKVEKAIPDFKERKAWLREHGWRIRIV